MLTLERTGVSLGSGIGSPALVPDVHKIAVLRANGLGDFIVALPALEALRAAYPRADIALLAKDWQVGFLSGRPGPVDRVIVVPPVRGISVAEDGPEGEERAIEEFFATMRAEHFDLAIQLHGGGRNSNPFVRRLGARVAAGLKTPDAVALDRWIPYNLYQPEILRYCEVMSLVGALPRTLAPGISVTPRDLAESLRVVPPTDKPLVAARELRACGGRSGLCRRRACDHRDGCRAAIGRGRARGHVGPGMGHQRTIESRRIGGPAVALPHGGGQ